MKWWIRMKYMLVVTLVFVAFVASSVQAQEASYELLWTYETDKWVDRVSVSSDGSYIAAGSGDERVHFFDRKGELLWSYETGSTVYDVSVSADGSYIAAGCGDKKVYFFDRKGELLWSYETGSTVYDVSVSADGSYIAVGSRDERVYFFNRNGKLLWRFNTGGWVQGVSVSADGSYIAAGSSDNMVYFFNREGKLLWNYETGDWAYVVAFSTDGSYIVVRSGDIVYLFNREGKLLWSYKTGGYVRSVYVSSDGSYVVAGSGDNKTYFFNRDGKLLWNYETGARVGDVSVSADGSYIAVRSGDRKIYFFNRDGKLLWNYRAGDGFSDVSVSSDGNYIVAGSWDDKVYFFKNILGEASNTILNARQAIVAVKSKELDIASTESLLSQAEQAFKAGEYSNAKSLAEQAKEKAEAISREATPAKTAIDDARSAISKEKAKGFNVVEAEALLEAALRSFETNDYSNAKFRAEKAKALAIDIDQDGMLNDKDFAPTIKNTYIYAGVFVFALSLILALKGVSFYMRKKRAKRETYEHEKAEIIAMIEEVVGVDGKNKNNTTSEHPFSQLHQTHGERDTEVNTTPVIPTNEFNIRCKEQVFEGEEFPLILEVYNPNNQKMSLIVTARTGGQLELLKTTEKISELKSGESAEVRFYLRAKKAGDGRVNLRLKYRLGSYKGMEKKVHRVRILETV